MLDWWLFLLSFVPRKVRVLKVLLIAPTSNLPLAQAEVQDILDSGLTVKSLFSPIRQVDVTREIRNGDYAGLWLCGHMDSSGKFPLDNNEALSASALTSFVRGRFEWVYLNTCQSIRTAQMIQNETEADVIATIVDVPDEDAYRTGSLFASWLARLDDPRAAYNESKPGSNSVYVYLAGSHRFLAKAPG